MHLSLRPATDADRDYARRTHHAAYRDVVTRQFGPFREAQQDTFFDRGWNQAPHEIILADGEPCGYAAIVEKENADHVYLLQVCVDPRMQNRGIGSFVVREAIRRANARGVFVRLSVLHENRAIALYRRHDFVTFERTETHFEMLRREGARPVLPEFVPALELCEAFYHGAVKPILDRQFPGLAYSAALVGHGSDVLGFDTSVSRDHGWGPRMQIFLGADDHRKVYRRLDDALCQDLPVSFRGYSTHFSTSKSDGVAMMRSIRQGPVNHLIEIDTIDAFLRRQLGVGTDDELAPVDWMTFPEQQLLVITAGRVFHDDLGLTKVRERFAYYPRDVWIYRLASQWALMNQLEAFVGRTSQAGDELGSRVLAGRMVDSLMRLCFLMEKRYAPYSKWYGTAFRGLRSAQGISPFLEGALAATNYADRERHLVAAYETVARMHNALDLTPALEPEVCAYSGWHLRAAGVAVVPEYVTRPHRVISSQRFASALRAEIRDPAVLGLPVERGSVDQFLVESSEAVQNPVFTRALRDHWAGS